MPEAATKPRIAPVNPPYAAPNMNGACTPWPSAGRSLDRCWDLLRQRRALRSAAGDPDQAHARDADTVEKYLQ